MIVDFKTTLTAEDSHAWFWLNYGTVVLKNGVEKRWYEYEMYIDTYFNNKASKFLCINFN